jgi:hypothetical protein
VTVADEPELPVGARSLRGDRLDPLEGLLTPDCGPIVGDPIAHARDQRLRAHGLVRAGDKPPAAGMSTLRAIDVVFEYR